MARWARFGRKRWLAVALALCVVVPAILSLQGCCSTFCTKWCNKRCAAHVVTIWEKDCPPGEPGLTSSPRSITVKRGQVVRFINGSRCHIVVKPSPPENYQLFDEAPENRIELRPGEVKELTVSMGATVAPGVEFTLVVEPVTPGCRWCPEYGDDGPGTEVDG
jgi:uncharacterized cupredoxin-like copper-binding protein